MFTAVRTDLLTGHIFLRSGVLELRDVTLALNYFLLTTSEMINGMHKSNLFHKLEEKRKDQNRTSKNVLVTATCR